MFNMNNEENENVLEKYGRNINEDVKNRKIDPIIGRDEEIKGNCYSYNSHCFNDMYCFYYSSKCHNK